MNDPVFPIPVVLKKLTGKTRGFCCLGSDYEPIIVINDQLSPEQKLKTYRHELQHIQNGDMFDPTYREYNA